MRRFRSLLLLAMLATLAAIVAGFFGALHPFFDTLSNFRLHLSILLVAMAALWSLRCSRMPAFVFALAGFAGVAACAPGLPITSHSIVPAAGEKTYRLFVMNLLWNNPTPQKVLRLIGELDPDILFLTEYFDRWRAPIAAIRERYPYSYHCGEAGPHGGSIILTRLPMADDDNYCGDYASLGLAHIVIGDKTITAGVVHLRWPWPASGPRQISALLPILRTIGPDALIAGDFNSTTWSYSVRRFADAGGLEIVRGIGPSWGPSRTIAGTELQWPQRLGLPIDNAMSKGAVHVISAKTQRDAGSDHLPLLIEFVVR